jgi:hypothetical protein
LSLDQTTRRSLEQIIDRVIEGLPAFVRILFNPERKAQLHIEKESDFSLGVAIGLIQQTFLISFLSTRYRLPNEQENSEIANVIFNRLPQIREAIFKAG